MLNPGKLPSSQSRATYRFAAAPSANMPRSSFDRSFTVKTTFNEGYLVPFFVDEVLPGDTFNVRANLFARLQTPIFPLMDNLYLQTYFFAVPCRLVWDNWQRFMGEQPNPGDTTDFVIPQVVAPGAAPGDGFSLGSLFDYFGLPTEIPGISISALPARAYNLIYNEWFRSEDLQDSVPVNVDNGPDDDTDYEVKRVTKRHDYFTSCLPYPQKGPAVTLPLGQSAPVVGFDQDTFVYSTSLTPADADVLRIANPVSGASSVFASGISGGSTPLRFSSETDEVGLIADLTDATASDINTVRQAFQIQRLLERDMRGGTRYTEILNSHFHVVSPDARLQRPEYLGGGITPVLFTPIAQTSSTDATSPQANLAAIATVFASGHGFIKSFVEHCYIIGLMAVRADLNYQQGINRMWSRRTRYDFYWPALAHLGEQAVLRKEIYAQGIIDPGSDDVVFGYQERWAEYRYKPGMITGEMRSIAAEDLDRWHLAQFFATTPFLNAEFIEEVAPMERVLAITDKQNFICDGRILMTTTRPMPLYSVPGLIDHF